jgi:hypothetical protein
MATLPGDIPRERQLVLALRVAGIIVKSRDVKSRWYARVYFGWRILDGMGSFPQLPGEKPRPDADRVTELKWQAERFAEIIEWDINLAARVLRGEDPLQLAVMMMRRETGQYEGAYGRLLHSLDAAVMKRIDATVDTTL